MSIPAGRLSQSAPDFVLSAGEAAMKKLSLNVDALNVESFDTSRAESPEGTVVAHAARTFPAPDVTCAYHCTWYPGTTCE